MLPTSSGASQQKRALIMSANGGFRLSLVQFCLVLVFAMSGTFSSNAQSIPQLPENAIPLDPGSLALRDLLAEVDVNRLMSHVKALEKMQTRHVASVQDQPEIGVGA